MPQDSRYARHDLIEMFGHRSNRAWASIQIVLYQCSCEHWYSVLSDCNEAANKRIEVYTNVRTNIGIDFA